MGGIKEILDRLRGVISDKAEEAYDTRDAAPPGSAERAYAEGEAHAYGLASDDVLAAETASEDEADPRK